MSSSTYWGSAVGLVREWDTTTGVAIGQDESSGDVSALCGTCFHAIHAIEFSWRCSDRACNKAYVLASNVETSLWDGYRFNTHDAMDRFKSWVAVWTGVNESRLSIRIDFT